MLGTGSVANSKLPPAVGLERRYVAASFLDSSKDIVVLASLGFRRALQSHGNIECRFSLGLDDRQLFLVLCVDVVDTDLDGSGLTLGLIDLVVGVELFYRIVADLLVGASESFLQFLVAHASMDQNGLLATNSFHVVFPSIGS